MTASVPKDTAPYFLGVDGGGTKTGFALIDGRGNLVFRTIKRASNYVQVGLAEAAGVIAEGIAGVCAAAGIFPADLAFAFMGLPAYGEIRGDERVLDETIRDILRHGRFRCGNDVEAGWAGSLACRPGIHLVAGTGAIGFGRDPSGGTARAGGWGEFFGDEGSAYWLGRQLVSLFAKEADGREEKTPLYEIVREEFGIDHDFDFIPAISNQLQFKREAVASLALLVHRAALQGDAKAAALYDAAALEHSLTARALLDRLHFPAGEAVPVSYSGGVFRAGELILAPLRKYLAGERCQLRAPLLQPATGAALYAMILSGQAIPPELVGELQKQETAVIQP